MDPQSQSGKPNTWALRLMGLMAENLHLRSENLNQAYRDCIAALVGEIAQSKRGRLRVVTTQHAQQPDREQRHGS